MAFKFIALFSILAVTNAGHLGHLDHHAGHLGHLGHHEYIHHEPLAHEYAPTIHKTIQYAAPAAKIIYEPKTVYAAKPVHEPEPIQYHNYHAAPHVSKTISYAPAAHIPSYGQTVSHYGKIVSSPHSYVKKYDTRIINEEPHYKVAAAYPATYSSAYAGVPAVIKSPVIPTIVKHFAPAVVKAPVYPVIKTHYHHEPEYTHGYAHSAPVLAHKTAVAYSPASVVAHTTFESSNAHYSW